MCLQIMDCPFDVTNPWSFPLQISTNLDILFDENLKNPLNFDELTYCINQFRPSVRIIFSLFMTRNISPKLRNFCSSVLL